MTEKLPYSSKPGKEGDYLSMCACSLFQDHTHSLFPTVTKENDYTDIRLSEETTFTFVLTCYVVSVLHDEGKQASLDILKLLCLCSPVKVRNNIFHSKNRKGKYISSFASLFPEAELFCNGRVLMSEGRLLLERK